MSVEDRIRIILEELSEREKEVLKKRFGIDISSPVLIEEVEKAFDITREKIEELEIKALIKLGAMNREIDEDE